MKLITNEGDELLRLKETSGNWVRKEYSPSSRTRLLDEVISLKINLSPQKMDFPGDSDDEMSGFYLRTPDGGYDNMDISTDSDEDWNMNDIYPYTPDPRYVGHYNRDYSSDSDESDEYNPYFYDEIDNPRDFNPPIQYLPPSPLAYEAEAVPELFEDVPNIFDAMILDAPPPVDAKERKRQYMSDYRRNKKNNPEFIQEKKTKKKAKKARDTQRATSYYQENKEKVLKKARERTDEERQIIRDKKKAWREANRERLIKKKRADYEANKDKWNALKKAKRRARKRDDSD